MKLAVLLDRKSQPPLGAEASIGYAPEYFGLIAMVAKCGPEIKPGSIAGSPPLFRTNQLWVAWSANEMQAALDRETSILDTLVDPVLAVVRETVIRASVGNAARRRGSPYFLEGADASR